MKNTLFCELASSHHPLDIYTQHPVFSWVTDDFSINGQQSAYRIIVSSTRENAESFESDMWDSGKISSHDCLNIKYSGKQFSPGQLLFWRVCLWGNDVQQGKWSQVGTFTYRDSSGENNCTCGRNKLAISRIAPEETFSCDGGGYFVKFAKAGFAALELTINCKEENRSLNVHLGEKLSSERKIDREPEGNVRYREIQLPLKKGCHVYQVEAPLIEGAINTQDASVKLPDYIPQLLPFRYCELESEISDFSLEDACMLMVHYPFNDEASSFESSDSTLNAVWDICKHTIKTTTFCGVYVDGDRERIPYEADVYINQLSHYAVDSEYSMARFSHEHTLQHPTWPTEWIMHSLLIAWDDYMYTSDSRSLAKNYSALKIRTLDKLAREDGLISTMTGLVTPQLLQKLNLDKPIKDIVDWPPREFTDGKYGERDDYVMTEYNTVVNAFHYRSLLLLSQIAQVVGNNEDARVYKGKARKVYDSFNSTFFDRESEVYVDGTGTEHSSLHANMFALAFGLVPEQHRQGVIKHIISRGMACSVYGAQYLLEGLFANGEQQYALSLITAKSDRSWWNMIRAGSTMTLEAWDWKYKNNLDWNHAWGTAPANIIMRYLMGVRPLNPGFGEVLIQPRPSGLEHFCGVCPSIRGGIGVEYRAAPDRYVKLSIPAGVSATVDLSFAGFGGDNSPIFVNGQKAQPDRGVISLQSGTWNISSEN